MWSKPQGATVALVEGLSPQLPAKATRGFQRGLGVAKEERCADVFIRKFELEAPVLTGKPRVRRKAEATCSCSALQRW